MKVVGTYNLNSGKFVAPAMATAVMGLFPPLICTAVGIDPFVNPIWANVYGLGVSLAFAAFEPPSFAFGVALMTGVVVWPLAIIVALAAILDRLSERRPSLIVALWMSLAVCLPVHTAAAWGLIPFPPGITM